MTGLPTIGLLVAGAAVTGVWALLVGTAILCRRLRVGRAAAAAAVLLCYAGMAATVLGVLGASRQGFAAAAGMLLPCTLALAVVALP